MRPALPPEVFTRTNLALRDAARPFTRVRDAKVLLDALDGLREHFGASADSASTEALEHALQSQRMRARRELTAEGNGVAAVLEAVHALGLQTRRWKLACDDWALLRRSVQRIYRNARRAYATVCEARSDERLHEWRKQVKHLLYTLQILTPLRPGRIGELADQAGKLAEYLGDDHDLAILRKQLDAQVYADDEAEEAHEQLEALIDRRRGDLQDRAFAVGARLFATKPRRLVKKIKRYWQAWQESPATPDEPAEAPVAARRPPEARARLH
jgi:CHAD domain-containing protein